MTLILLPQADRRMLPVLIAQLVVLLKDSSLGFIIGYFELLRRRPQPGRVLHARASATSTRSSCTWPPALIYIIINVLLSAAGQVRREADPPATRRRRPPRTVELPADVQMGGARSAHSPPSDPPVPPRRVVRDTPRSGGDTRRAPWRRCTPPDGAACRPSRARAPSGRSPQPTAPSRTPTPTSPHRALRVDLRRGAAHDARPRRPERFRGRRSRGRPAGRGRDDSEAGPVRRRSRTTLEDDRRRRPEATLRGDAPATPPSHAPSTRRTAEPAPPSRTPPRTFVARLRSAAADFAEAAGAASAVVREAVPPARHRRARCRLVLRYADETEVRRDLPRPGRRTGHARPGTASTGRSVAGWAPVSAARTPGWSPTPTPRTASPST